MGNITFPITVNSISVAEQFGFKKSLLAKKDEKCGAWVSIRPIDEALKGKTFLGIYLGDLCNEPAILFHPATGNLEVKPFPMGNPAIYIPDLKRIVMGYESWWGIISSPEQLRQITDVDIQNVWYVRALKELSEKQNSPSPSAQGATEDDN